MRWSTVLPLIACVVVACSDDPSGRPAPDRIFPDIGGVGTTPDAGRADTDRPSDARPQTDGGEEGDEEVTPPIDGVSPDGGGDLRDVTDGAETTDTPDVTDPNDGSDTAEPTDVSDTSDGSDGGGTRPEDYEEAEILQTGTNGLLLRGRVLVPGGVLNPGEVLVVGNVIVCVAESCRSDFRAADATWVETNGVISPGLIDAHNHIAYNFLPEWIPPDERVFDNRYQWADEPSYEDHVRPYAKYRSTNTHFCPAARWGEFRSILHGTTTVQGQSFQRACTRGLTRNADHDHDLGPNHMRTSIASPRDINDAAAQNYLDSFASGTTRFAVHMQEGVSGNNVLSEFESFAGRDPRPNRHQGVSLLGFHSVLIHSVSLTEAQLVETRDANAKIVWSPSSNLVLYGETAPIARMVELGITIGLGPDWTPSGEDHMLAELRFARDYVEAASIRNITDELLWQMATVDGAEVVGLEEQVGRLEVGYVADITVFRDYGSSRAFDEVIEARSDDVRLVLIDGQAYYGDATLSTLGRNALCEPFNACGTEKFFCARDSAAGEYGLLTVSQIRQRLIDILEGNGYPADEQYGRGDELFELVDCSE
jgi:5-methylthioadenosine/S-adenosylhomocysteine deaminase